MAQRYKRKVPLLVAVALLAAALWWLLPARLSPLEQSLVGSGRCMYEVGPCVLDMRPDRSFQFRRVDGKEIGPGLYSQEGKWHAANGVLVFDSRSARQTLFPVEIVAGGTGPGGVPLPGLRRLRPGEVEVIGLTDNELTVRALSSGKPFRWKRFVEPNSK